MGQRCLSHLALAGEDGGDELRVGMPPPVKIADDGLRVERHAAVRDHQFIAGVFKEQPAGGAAGAGQSRTAGVEGPDIADKTVGGVVSVAADNDVGARSGE